MRWIPVVLLAGCATVAPVERYQSIASYGQVAVEPSPVHYGTYLVLSDCTGRTRDFTGIEWFVADSIITSEGQRVWGLWTTERKIVLDSQLYWFVPLIAHELLHDLYRGPTPPDMERQCTPGMGREALERMLHR